MKKNLMLLLLVVFVLTIFSGCGLGSWEFYLPNNYVVKHAEGMAVTYLYNEYKFIKTRDNDGNTYREHVIIDNFITGVCYNDIWIAVKQVPVPDNIISDKDLKNMDLNNPEYYLINMQYDTIKSHMTEKQFRDEIQKKGIDSLCEWISTYPSSPQGAKWY